MGTHQLDLFRDQKDQIPLEPIISDGKANHFRIRLNPSKETSNLIYEQIRRQAQHANDPDFYKVDVEFQISCLGCLLLDMSNSFSEEEVLERIDVIFSTDKVVSTVKITQA